MNRSGDFELRDFDWIYYLLLLLEVRGCVIKCMCFLRVDLGRQIIHGNYRCQNGVNDCGILTEAN